MYAGGVCLVAPRHRCGTVGWCWDLELPQAVSFRSVGLTGRAPALYAVEPVPASGAAVMYGRAGMHALYIITCTAAST